MTFPTGRRGDKGQILSPAARARGVGQLLPAVTSGRDVFTRGRYFFTSGRDVFRSELLGLFHHVIPQFVVLLEKTSHSSGYSLFLCDSSFPEGMSGVLTDYSHQPRQNLFYDLSHHACKYIIVITVNEPSPLAPLTPALGAGGVGGVGCFLLVPIIIRARARSGGSPVTISFAYQWGASPTDNGIHCFKEHMVCK